MRRSGRRWPGSMAASIPANEITEDWKKVLFNQFHDLAAGSGHRRHLQGRAEGLRRGAATRPMKSRRRALQTVGRAREHARARACRWSSTIRSAGSAPAKSPCMCRAARAQSARSGAQVVEAKPDEKTGVSDVRLHVLHVPALGYKVVWVGRQGAPEAAREATREAKDSGGAITLENATLRVSRRQADRLHHQPVRQEVQFRNAGIGRMRQSTAVLQRHIRRTTTRGTSIRARSMFRRRPSTMRIQWNC